jgi:hypothetical protein
MCPAGGSRSWNQLRSNNTSAKLSTVFLQSTGKVQRGKLSARSATRLVRLPRGVPGRAVSAATTGRPNREGMQMKESPEQRAARILIEQNDAASRQSPGLAFDLGSMLGIGPADPSPLPTPEAGECIVRVSEPFSLLDVRNSAAGERYWFKKDYRWFNKVNRMCSRQQVPVGVYRVRVPVPGSNNKTFTEQRVHMFSSEVVAPVALVAAVLLCIAQSGAPDPLRGGWVRCTEQPRFCRVVLKWCEGQLGIGDDSDDFPSSDVWVAACRE